MSGNPNPNPNPNPNLNPNPNPNPNPNREVEVEKKVRHETDLEVLGLKQSFATHEADISAKEDTYT